MRREWNKHTHNFMGILTANKSFISEKQNCLKVRSHEFQIRTFSLRLILLSGELKWQLETFYFEEDMGNIP
jgi:hypothetical protein